MNRVERDYCSKRHHPRWRAWTTKYDHSTVNLKRIGDFCDFCGKQITDTVANGAPNTNEATQKRYLKYLERRHALIRNLRIKGIHYGTNSTNKSIVYVTKQDAKIINVAET